MRVLNQVILTDSRPTHPTHSLVHMHSFTPTHSRKKREIQLTTQPYMYRSMLFRYQHGSKMCTVSMLRRAARSSPRLLPPSMLPQSRCVPHMSCTHRCCQNAAHTAWTGLRWVARACRVTACTQNCCRETCLRPAQPMNKSQ